MNRVVIIILLGLLSACTGLTSQSSGLDVGSTKEEVLKALGNPLEQSNEGAVIAWQYGARVALGYCEYKDFFFSGNKVIHINQYYNSSVAGCLAGMREIDWGPVLSKAR